MAPIAAGLDLGTTSVKAALFSIGDEVELVCEKSVDYPLATPEPGAAEQDADTVCDSALEALASAAKEADAGDIACVSFSGAMHSLLAVDDKGCALTPVLTFADTRAAQQAADIRRRHDGHAIYERTGTPLHAMSPLAKLVWLRAARRDAFESAAKFVSLKEYLCHRMFGRFVVDHSIASATGLLNLERLEWDEGALEVAGIEASRLSELVPTTEILGEPGAAAHDLGLPPGVQFVIGASDGCLANLGSAAVEPGIVSATIGTSGAVRSVVNAPITDPRGRTFCYALTRDHWVVGGPISNGGIVLRWFKEQLGGAEISVAKRLGEDVYDLFTAMAERAGPGADGLLFLPFLAGERAPNWDSNARGALFGLSLEHRKEHVVRAILEGVVYSLWRVEQIRSELAGPGRQVRVSGGFTKSKLWRQILADVFGVPVSTPIGYESSGLGAALLGLVATGDVKDLAAAAGLVAVRDTQEPDAGNRAIYDEMLRLYDEVYDRLQPLFDDITALQTRAELGRAGTGDNSKG